MPMKKVIYYSLLILLISNCTPTPTIEKNYPEHVGDIAEDPQLDDPNFKVCNEDYVIQYYSANYTSTPQLYKGEKPAILEYFKQYSHPKTEGQSGYITIRFIVNCKGETGRFRMQQMGSNHQAFTFDEAISSQLMKLTKALPDWQAYHHTNGEIIDYYQYLTFKLQDGQIIEILP